MKRAVVSKVENEGDVILMRLGIIEIQPKLSVQEFNCLIELLRLGIRHRNQYRLRWNQLIGLW
jgi:hypothetical protein